MPKHRGFSIWLILGLGAAVYLLLKNKVLPGSTAAGTGVQTSTPKNNQNLPPGYLPLHIPTEQEKRSTPAFILAQKYGILKVQKQNYLYSVFDYWARQEPILGRTISRYIDPTHFEDTQGNTWEVFFY